MQQHVACLYPVAYLLVRELAEELDAPLEPELANQIEELRAVARLGGVSGRWFRACDLVPHRDSVGGKERHRPDPVLEVLDPVHGSDAEHAQLWGPHALARPEVAGIDPGADHDRLRRIEPEADGFVSDRLAHAVHRGRFREGLPIAGDDVVEADVGVDVDAGAVAAHHEWTPERCGGRVVANGLRLPLEMEHVGPGKREWKDVAQERERPCRPNEPEQPRPVPHSERDGVAARPQDRNEKRLARRGEADQLDPRHAGAPVFAGQESRGDGRMHPVAAKPGELPLDECLGRPAKPHLEQPNRAGPSISPVPGRRAHWASR